MPIRHHRVYFKPGCSAKTPCAALKSLFTGYQFIYDYQILRPGSGTQRDIGRKKFQHLFWNRHGQLPQQPKAIPLWIKTYLLTWFKKKYYENISFKIDSNWLSGGNCIHGTFLQPRLPGDRTFR